MEPDRKMTKPKSTTRNTQTGFSLIEVIAFIVIAGIIAAALAHTFAGAARGTANAAQITLGTQMAKERMELIFAQKRVLGFACFTDDVNGRRFDPCSAAAAAGSCPATAASAHPSCTVPANYSISATLDAATCNGGNAAYKCITVTVSGPGGTLSRIDAWVTDY